MLAFITGPELPKKLWGHSSLTLGHELILVGGKSTFIGSLHYSSSLYKMSCNNGILSDWIEVEAHLKLPRYDFVASFIPNNLIDSQSTS